MTDRRFPPPWSVRELEACFIVVASAGQKLAFVRGDIAKLPDLLGPNARVNDPKEGG
jgi:hypothetical protein